MAKQVPVVDKITDKAKDIYTRILKSQKPTMSTPVRSLSNVKYQARKGYFEMLGKNKVRTLTVSTVKTFAQTLKMMSLSKELIETDDMATKREAYYISKNWGKAGFAEQPESDTIMDDVEAMFGVNREQLKFVPEEKGGDIAGKLIVIDRDNQGRKLKIDCTKFGSGAYSIPSDVEALEFQSKAKFILAIETAGAKCELGLRGRFRNHRHALEPDVGLETGEHRVAEAHLPQESELDLPGEEGWCSAHPAGTQVGHFTICQLQGVVGVLEDVGREQQLRVLDQSEGARIVVDRSQVRGASDHRPGEQPRAVPVLVRPVLGVLGPRRVPRGADQQQSQPAEEQFAQHMR